MNDVVEVSGMELYPVSPEAKKIVDKCFAEGVQLNPMQVMIINEIVDDIISDARTDAWNDYQEQY